MKVQTILVLCCIIGLSIQDGCTVADPDKIDCGFVGIDQQKCQAKNCCWQPVQNDNIPWCFFQQGDQPCQNITLKSNTPGFDQTWYDGMQSKYYANLDMFGQGGVVAAPDNSTPGGSYFFHWMRDGALSMRVFMEINDLKLEAVKEKMDHYTQWVLTVQSKSDPNQIDVRIEPKFTLNDQNPYTGGWCRPQTDGPGLRATALAMYANILLDKGQEQYVRDNLWTSGAKNGGAIKYDLDWVVKNWQQDGCDLWEEVRSNDFFWGRMAFRYALDYAAKLATRLGDSALAASYTSTSNQIKATLDGHWTGTFMAESTNRQKDASVTHAFATFPGVYSPTDAKVAGTIKTYNILFCVQNPINQIDDKARLGGVLYGRYQGDGYAGGNPWQLLSAVLGELFYQGAQEMLAKYNSNDILQEEFVQPWRQILSLEDGQITAQQFVAAQLSAGDSVMNRIYTHVKGDGYMITEQISKVDGKQLSAKNLTWSYANILHALHVRNSQLMPMMKSKKFISQ